MGPLMAGEKTSLDVMSTNDEWCPFRGIMIGTLKAPSCPWRWVPGSRSNYGNWTTVPSLYS